MARKEWFSPVVVDADEGFAFTWRGVAGLILAPCIAGLVIAAFGLVVRVGGFETRSEIDQAHRKNVALRMQREVLLDQSFELARRTIEAVEESQRIARLSGAGTRDWEGESSPLPPRSAGNEDLRDWLSERQRLLVAVEEQLEAPRPGTNVAAVGSARNGPRTPPTPDSPTQAAK